ncbi:MAG: sodium:solute symporter family protein, partial [Puniceicoccales bacterium]
AAYGTMAWQNAGSYNSAGANPHESRMGGLLGRWRETGKGAVVTLLAISALTFINHPEFSDASQAARDSIAGIQETQIQKQMTIPVALSHMLPIGVKGALCAVLLFGIFGGDSTHLHSWGGILAQDVILPRLKKKPTPKGHILLLRCCIIFVALFAFLFGAFFVTTEYIMMWWQVTTSVYVGGAGSAIIGGLYWKKGTTAGAWSAMISGAILSGGGILVYKIWGAGVFSVALNWVLTGVGLEALPPFTLNGIQIGFSSTLIAISLYTGVSLLTCRQDFNLNKMLHRDEAPLDEAGNPIKKPKKKLSISGILGIDSDFTTGDKVITYSLFGWSVFLFSLMLIGTSWNLIGIWGVVGWIKPWTNDDWLGFWHVIAIGLPVMITVITGIWFTWGGLRDIRSLFRSLKTYQIDDSDNGTVEDHRPY